MRWVRVAAIAAGLLLIVAAAPPTVRAQEPMDDLESLVAPIALYPDGLLAQVLVAATYPEGVNDAARWLAQHASYTPDQIARAVDPVDWDPSVKGLTAFPMVLTMMADNLSWTSALGDAYYNDPDGVLDAVQSLRRRAMTAGTLAGNSRIAVMNRAGTIVIEPTTIETVYVPSYDAWTVYGPPIAPWPAFVAPRIFLGPRVRWDLMFHVGGFWARVGWGWRYWLPDWSHRRVLFHREVYESRSPSMFDRRGRSIWAPGPPPGRGQGEPPGRGRSDEQGRGRSQPPGRGRDGGPPIGTAIPRPTPPGHDDRNSDRGFPADKTKATPPSGTRSGIFSGFGQGGPTTSDASRGRSSMGAPPPQPPPKTKEPPPPPPKNKGRGGL